MAKMWVQKLQINFKGIGVRVQCLEDSQLIPMFVRSGPMNLQSAGLCTSHANARACAFTSTSHFHDDYEDDDDGQSPY